MRSFLGRIVLHPRYILIVFLSGLALRLLWALFVHPTQVSDFAWYVERGVGIANGEGYSQGGIPTAYWPVGYPAFLGVLFYLFGAHTGVAIFAQVVLSIGTLVFSYLLAKQWTESEVTARISLLILAFYPNILYYTTITGSETLDLFLLVLGLFLSAQLNNRRMMAASGAVAGVLCLVRPQLGILLFLFLVFSLLHAHWRKKGQIIKSVLLAIIVFAAVLTPWTIRNYRVFHHLIFVSNNGGVNLLIGNNPTANGKYYLSDWISDRLAPIVGEIEVDRVARHLAFRYMAMSPGADLKLIPAKLSYLFLRDAGKDGMNWNVHAFNAKTQNWLGRLAAAVYLVLLACFALSLVYFLLVRFLSRKSLPQGFGRILTPIAYVMLLSIIFFGVNRFNFPAIPFFAFLVGLTVSHFLQRDQAESEPITRPDR